jgi:hypothetical protein
MYKVITPKYAMKINLMNFKFHYEELKGQLDVPV